MMKDVRFSPDNVVLESLSATRPKSGRTTVVRNGSRILKALPKGDRVRPGSPNHLSRPASRITNGRTSSLHHHDRSPTVISDRVYNGNYRTASRASTLKTVVTEHTTSQLEGMACPKSSKSSASALKIEPAFIDIVKCIPRFTIFRLENKGRLWPIDDEEHGFFHEGAAYLVVKIDNDETTWLHYWTGASCPQEEALLIQTKAHELDRILNFAEIFSKETQNAESCNFMRHFQTGIVYLESRPRTTVGRAVSYAKRMYLVFGRSYVRAQCTEPVLGSLDSNAASILDGCPRIYVWIGKSCPYLLRIKTLRIAKRIRDSQRKGISHIVVIEETDQPMDEAFKKKLQARSPPEVCSEMRNFDRTIVLHRVSGDRVMYDMPEASHCPLRHRYLVTNDSYLLDRGSQNTLYIWVGRRTQENHAQNAIKRGQSFCCHKGYPPTLSICRIAEDHEPAEFRKNFYDWREREVKGRQMTKRFNIGNIERVLFTTKDNRTVAKMDELWSEDTFPDGETDTKVYAVCSNIIEERDFNTCATFVTNKCYIVHHRIHSYLGVDNILYYWLGSKSSTELQEKTKNTTIEMNQIRNNNNIMVRVLDGKEPVHFMATLNNSLILFDSDLQGNDHTIQMFTVHEFPSGCYRVQQVKACSSNLNSSATIILITEIVCHLWYGKFSGGPEREYAKNVLSLLCPSRKYTFEISTEGKESASFWEAIGPASRYKEEFSILRLERRPPELYRLDLSEDEMYWMHLGAVRQSQLCDENVLVLDIYDTIYLWIGKAVPEKVRSKQHQIAKSFINQDSSGRCLEDIDLWTVSQGHESDVFRKYFRVWEPDGYTDKQFYDALRRLIRQENAVINIEQQLVDRHYIHMPKYDYKELTHIEELPLDVNKEHREFHLRDKCFKQVLRQTRADFYRNPAWKQKQILKSAKLMSIPDPSFPLKLCTTE